MCRLTRGVCVGLREIRIVVGGKGVLLFFVIDRISLEFSDRIDGIEDEAHLIVLIDLPGTGEPAIYEIGGGSIDELGVDCVFVWRGRGGSGGGGARWASNTSATRRGRTIARLWILLTWSPVVRPHRWAELVTRLALPCGHLELLARR